MATEQRKGSHRSDCCSKKVKDKKVVSARESECCAEAVSFCSLR